MGTKTPTKAKDEATGTKPRRGSTSHLRLAEATTDEIEQALAGEMPETPLGEDLDDIEDETPSEEETTADKQHRGAGKKETRAPAEYSCADPVQTLGKLIINQSYPELLNVPVAYVFASDLGKSGGEVQIMKTVKRQGLDAWGWLHYASATPGPGDPFFVILVSESHWQQMSQGAREAMLDSHLARCGVRKKSGALHLQKPDFMEFSTVISRRGLYTNKLKDAGQIIARIAMQGELDLAAGS